MPVPEMITLRQAPPPNSKSDYFFEPNTSQKETQILENYNPKNSSPTLGKILSLLFLLSFLVLNPPVLMGIVVYSISAFILLNSPNNYSKRFEPKIAKVEILESKIIEIEPTPLASQPPPLGANPPQKSDDNANFEKYLAKIQKTDNGKFANKIKNFLNTQNKLKSETGFNPNFTK